MISDRYRERCFVVGILALGFLLRIAGIQFGLPHLYHADEPIVVHHALAYGTGDLNPHFFKLPPLVSYLLFIVYGLYYLTGRELGFFSDLAEFQVLFISDPSIFYLLARFIFGVVLGTATIWVFYRLLKNNFSTEHGLLSSFFLATNFLHVRDSHYVYLDIPLLLVVVVSFFPMMKIAERNVVRDYIECGLLIGLAAAVKYNGIFLFTPFLVAHFLRNGPILSSAFSPRLVLTFILAGISYVVLNPFSVIDFRFFLDELLQQANAEGGVGWTHHLTYSLSGALGPLLLLLSVLGVVFSMSGPGRKKKLIFLSLIVAYFIVLSVFSQPYDRYVLPIVPFCIFFAVDFVLNLQARFQISHAVAIPCMMLVAVPPLAKAYLADQLFIRRDVRTVAMDWINENIKENAKIAMGPQFFTPRLRTTVDELSDKKKEIELSGRLGKAKLKRLDLMIEQAEKNGTPTYELMFLNESLNHANFTFSKPTVPYDLETLQQEGVEYVILSRISKSHQSEFYKQLKGNSLLMKRFSPFKDKTREYPIDIQPLTGGPFLWRDLVGRERNGQIIEIYRLEPQPNTELEKQLPRNSYGLRGASFPASNASISDDGRIKARPARHGP